MSARPPLLLLALLAAGCPAAPLPPNAESVVEAGVFFVRLPAGAGLPLPDRLAPAGPADASIRGFSFDAGFFAALPDDLARRGLDPPRRVFEARWTPGALFTIDLGDAPAGAVPPGLSDARFRLHLAARAEALWGGALRLELEPRLSPAGAGPVGPIPRSTKIRPWPKPAVVSIPDGGGILLSVLPLEGDPGAAWAVRFVRANAPVPSDLAPR